MKKLLSLALTASAVAAFFGMHADATVRADADAMSNLQNRLVELTQAAANVQARADAEKRGMTDDERKEVKDIFAEFESVQAEIERREQISAMQTATAAPQARQTEPNGGTDPQASANPNASRAQQEAGASRARASVPAVPKDHRDTGKWGFRSEAEFYSAVLKSSGKGAVADPRLIANAPTTYGSEGVGADGGFAVPPDFRTQIVRKVLGEDSLLGRTDQMTTSSNAITVPTDETTPWQTSGGIQAYWESEGGQKTQSKPALTEKTVKANKIIALVPMTDELLQDAPAMAAYVSSRAPEKIDFKVNDAIINGTGVGMPLGILNSGSLVTVAPESGQAPDSLMFENVNNMWTRMYAPSRRNAVWLMNSDVEGMLPYLKFIDQGNGNAVPVYLPPNGAADAPFGRLYGRPIISSEAMPALGDAGDIVLADMSQYMSVVKAGGIRQDVSIHLFFDYDITTFRFVLRVGGQPWWNIPIERLHGNSRSPFVALGARS